MGATWVWGGGRGAHRPIRQHLHLAGDSGGGGRRARTAASVYGWQLRRLAIFGWRVAMALGGGWYNGGGWQWRWVAGEKRRRLAVAVRTTPT